MTTTAGSVSQKSPGASVKRTDKPKPSTVANEVAATTTTTNIELKDSLGRIAENEVRGINPNNFIAQVDGKEIDAPTEEEYEQSSNALLVLEDKLTKALNDPDKVDGLLNQVREVSNVIDRLNFKQAESIANDLAKADKNITVQEKKQEFMVQYIGLSNSTGDVLTRMMFRLIVETELQSTKTKNPKDREKLKYSLMSLRQELFRQRGLDIGREYMTSLSPEKAKAYFDKVLTPILKLHDSRHELLGKDSQKNPDKFKSGQNNHEIIASQDEDNLIHCQYDGMEYFLTTAGLIKEKPPEKGKKAETPQQVKAKGEKTIADILKGENLTALKRKPIPDYPLDVVSEPMKQFGKDLDTLRDELIELCGEGKAKEFNAKLKQFVSRVNAQYISSYENVEKQVNKDPINFNSHLILYIRDNLQISKAVRDTLDIVLREISLENADKDKKPENYDNALATLRHKFNGYRGASNAYERLFDYSFIEGVNTGFVYANNILNPRMKKVEEMLRNEPPDTITHKALSTEKRVLEGESGAFAGFKTRFDKLMLLFGQLK